MYACLIERHFAQHKNQLQNGKVVLFLCNQMYTLGFVHRPTRKSVKTFLSPYQFLEILSFQEARLHLRCQEGPTGTLVILLLL